MLKKMVLIVLALGLTSACFGWTAREKLMAKRAAELDAYRKLAERIRGFRITSDTSVRDFVTESDQINTALNTFLKGVRTERVRWLADGTCEVTVAVTLRQVVRTLKRIYTRYYKGDRIRANDFDRIIRRTRKRVIRETGSGAPRDMRPEQIEEVEEDIVIRPRARRRKLPAIWRKYPPNERLMAKRAAELDAYRKLAERIRGFRITSDTTVRDFVTESDRINTALNTFLKGVRTVDVRYLPDGIVEVDVEVTLRKVIRTLKRIYNRYYKGNRIRANDFNNIVVRYKKKIIRETGSGAPRQRRRIDQRPRESEQSSEQEIQVEETVIEVE